MRRDTCVHSRTCLISSVTSCKSGCCNSVASIASAVSQTSEDVQQVNRRKNEGQYQSDEPDHRLECGCKRSGRRTVIHAIDDLVYDRDGFKVEERFRHDERAKTVLKAATVLTLQVDGA